MSKTKSNFVQGACFSYYDEKFTECLECKIKEACQNALNSPDVNEIRKIPKISLSIVDELAQKYTNIPPKPPTPTPEQIGLDWE